MIKQSVWHNSIIIGLRGNKLLLLLWQYLSMLWCLMFVMYSAAHHVIQYRPIRGRHHLPIREGPDGFVYVWDSQEIWLSSNRRCCWSFHTPNCNTDTIIIPLSVFCQGCTMGTLCTNRCQMSLPKVAEDVSGPTQVDRYFCSCHFKSAVYFLLDTLSEDSPEEERRIKMLINSEHQTCYLCSKLRVS